MILDSSEDENEGPPPPTSQKKSLKDLYSCQSSTLYRGSMCSPKATSAIRKYSSCSNSKSFFGTPRRDLTKPTALSSTLAMDRFDEPRDASWPHLSYPFLQPDLIKDAHGRRPSHPDYDPKTLFVPENFLQRQSPALKQWWNLKSQNFDTLLFFKMGKFYELYHMDAVIAVEELKLSYMRGEFAHAGFPEIAFQRMADHLLHHVSLRLMLKHEFYY